MIVEIFYADQGSFESINVIFKKLSVTFGDFKKTVKAMPSLKSNKIIS